MCTHKGIAGLLCENISICCVMILSLLSLLDPRAHWYPSYRRLVQGEVKCREECTAMPNVGDNKISTVARIKFMGSYMVKSLNAQCIDPVILNNRGNLVSRKDLGWTIKS